MGKQNEKKGKLLVKIRQRKTNLDGKETAHCNNQINGVQSSTTM